MTVQFVRRERVQGVDYVVFDFTGWDGERQSAYQERFIAPAQQFVAPSGRRAAIQCACVEGYSYGGTVADSCEGFSKLADRFRWVTFRQANLASEMEREGRL
jgi:hypothetical protein